MRGAEVELGPHHAVAAHPFAFRLHPHPTREVPLSLAGRAWRAR